jgi:hypothetical protein
MWLPRAAATVSELIFSMRTNWVNRVERSTNVATADPPVPQIRSPSQCPGTARSAAR